MIMEASNETPDEALDATGTNLPLRSYDLVGERSRETQHFALESRLTIRSTSGKLKSLDTFRQFLLVTPGDPSDGEADRLTCSRFSIQRGDDPEVGIPSLEGFSYDVNRELLDENGIDDQGRLYGIPEELFEGLTDSTGEKLSFEIGYQVYSVFFPKPSKPTSATSSPNSEPATGSRSSSTPTKPDSSTATTMWGIPVNKSVPTTNLTIKAISQEDFDKG